MAENTRLTPNEVHEVLAAHLLTDPSALVVDLERSRGSRIVDARTGRRYLAHRPKCVAIIGRRAIGVCRGVVVAGFHTKA